MSGLVVTLGVWSVACNVGFLADFLIGSKRRMNGLTGRDVVGSSLGSLVVLSLVLGDAMLNRPSSLLAHLAVMVFATVGYPAWWVRMRQLTAADRHHDRR